MQPDVTEFAAHSEPTKFELSLNAANKESTCSDSLSFVSVIQCAQLQLIDAKVGSHHSLNLGIELKNRFSTSYIFFIAFIFNDF